MAEEVLCTLRNLIKIHLKESYDTAELIQSLETTISHLEWLVNRHASKKYSDDYLSSLCFSKAKWFDTPTYNAYCKVNLKLGTTHLKHLLSEIKERPIAEIESTIADYQPFLHDTLHDLRPFATFLESKKNKNYVFFEGAKSATSESWALYDFAKSLYYATCDHKNPLSRFHKESHAASAFVLRQALEVKFERIIGVTAFDLNGNEPKLKHGFHYEFAKKHSELFDFQDLKFDLVKRVYDWCSHVVHNALQPLAWQMPYAFDICHGLYASGDYGPNGGWSIHGGVRVFDIGEMQSNFSKYLLDNYDHGVWCFYFRKPEAADFSRN